MKVNIYFIRHGFSCTNAIVYYAKFRKQYKRVLYTDPALTLHSQRQIQNITQYMPPVDILCSSVLLRAIQTGLLSYPKKPRTLFPLPFVSEFGKGYGNRASSPPEQLGILGFDLSKRIDYRFVTDASTPYKFIPSATVPDYEAFVKWLGVFLPQLMKAAGVGRKKELNIALVTHSKFMSTYFSTGDDHLPHNNAVLLRRYNYENQTITPLPCPKIDSFYEMSDSNDCGGMVYLGLTPPDANTYVQTGGHGGCKYPELFD